MVDTVDKGNMLDAVDTVDKGNMVDTVDKGNMVDTRNLLKGDVVEMRGHAPQSLNPQSLSLNSERKGDSSITIRTNVVS